MSTELNYISVKGINAYNVEVN